jgi:hypothetical protein
MLETRVRERCYMCLRERFCVFETAATFGDSRSIHLHDPSTDSLSKKVHHFFEKSVFIDIRTDAQRKETCVFKAI